MLRTPFTRVIRFTHSKRHGVYDHSHRSDHMVLPCNAFMSDSEEPFDRNPWSLKRVLTVVYVHGNPFVRIDTFSAGD